MGGGGFLSFSCFQYLAISCFYYALFLPLEYFTALSLLLGSPIIMYLYNNSTWQYQQYVGTSVASSSKCYGTYRFYGAINSSTHRNRTVYGIVAR